MSSASLPLSTAADEAGIDDEHDDHDPAQLRRVRKVVDQRSFAVLSTVSIRGHPHAAGVVYDNIDYELYVHTMRSSRKARNVVATGRAGVVIATRRLPIGPPFTVQFQATAAILSMDDPHIVELIDAGRLGTVSGHGALDEPDGCFVRLTPTGRVHTYGIGVSIVALARDPLHAGARHVRVG